MLLETVVFGNGSRRGSVRILSKERGRLSYGTHHWEFILSTLFLLPLHMKQFTRR